MKYNFAPHQSTYEYQQMLGYVPVPRREHALFNFQHLFQPTEFRELFSDVPIN